MINTLWSNVNGVFIEKLNWDSSWGLGVPWSLHGEDLNHHSHPINHSVLLWNFLSFPGNLHFHGCHKTFEDVTVKHQWAPNLNRLLRLSLPSPLPSYLLPEMKTLPKHIPHPPLTTPTHMHTIILLVYRTFLKICGLTSPTVWFSLAV